MAVFCLSRYGTILNNRYSRLATTDLFLFWCVLVYVSKLDHLKLPVSVLLMASLVIVAVT